MHPTMDPDARLFPAVNPGDNFSRSFAKLIHALVALDGVDRLPNVATHSIRKGAVTFALSGCTSGPSIGVLTTRAGWSLGDVLDRYIHTHLRGTSTPDLLHQLAPNVTINDGNIRRTGIPPHVHMYTQLEVMRNELQSTRDELQTARSELHNVHGKVDIILAELQSMRTASTPGWILWFLGNDSTQDRPFRCIHSSDLATEAAKNMYVHWKHVMRRMEDIFEAETGAKPHDHDRPSDRHVTESFGVVFRVLGPQLTGRNKKRKRDETDLKVATVSGILHKMKRSAY
ncbi:hypothetical protein DYB37_012691 [Aphanomyces astaci]|uniref:Uncharacterized protein n=1 Tax=Aphanomyces astaci TaxID=112090 RepID=A0A3R7BB21_APHAT|nr:hypothetical protein DYB37_012691 [Aphanomyces astaci]